MPADCFLDSNCVVYAFSVTELAKRERAEALLREPGACLSTQVLNELANVLVRKFRQPFPAISAAMEYVIAAVQVRTVDIQDMRHALILADRYHYSYYDSLILATAISLGCTTLYSEDMQHGQVIHGTLTIINPFKEL